MSIITNFAIALYPSKRTKTKKSEAIRELEEGETEIVREKGTGQKKRGERVEGREREKYQSNKTTEGIKLESDSEYTWKCAFSCSIGS